MDSPTRKKYIPGEGSPFIYHQSTVAHNNMTQFKSFFPPNHKANGE